MSVRKASVQSSCYLFWVVLFVLIAIIPVSASDIVSPDINPGTAVHIGEQQSNLAAGVLTIYSNKDSVSRGGGRFSVTITGSPLTFYYLWIKNTSTMTGEPQDQPPYIYVSETVYQDPMGGPFTIGSHPIIGGGGRTIIDDIPPSTANISNIEYYAAIRTNNRGIATVEWNTPVAAKPGSYTIHVEGDTLSADAVVVVGSGINHYYGPVTGFAARPEKVIFHPAINTMGGTIANNDLTKINQGTRVFIGEEGLNVSPALTSAQALTGSSSTTLGWWAFVDPLSYTTTKTIDLAGQDTNFFVSPANLSGYYGNWYLVNPSTGLAYNSSGSPVLVLTLVDPSLDIRIWNADWATDITGTSTTIGENLTFRIDTNMYRALDQVSRPDITHDTQGFITIKVKDETGAALNYLYRENSTIQVLTNLSVNTSPWFWGGGTNPSQNYWATDLLDRDHYLYYPVGTYSISAESSLNNMRDNYLSGGAAYTGRTVSEIHTITIVSEQINIVTNHNSIIRGSPFSVAVGGRPFATYHLWVENTSTMTGNYHDQPPCIDPYQVGIIVNRDPGLTNSIPVFPEAGAYQFQGGGGKAIYQDVAPGWPGSTSSFLKNGTTEYANITLNSHGSRTVQFATTNWTKPQKYTIRVERVFPINYSAEGGDVWRDSVEVTVEERLPTPTVTPDPANPSAGSDVSPDSGTTGQSVASHPGAGPGQSMMFSFSQSGGTVTISQVELVPGQQIGPLELIIQPVSPGQVLKVPGLSVAGYEKITPIGVNPSAIDHGTITFGVSGAWLTGHNAAQEDIVLMRYNDTRWDALPTRFKGQSGNIFYFIADTPGFSYFAVVVKPVGSSAVNTSITPFVTQQVQAIATSTIPHDTLLKIPDQSLTTVSQTPPVPPASPARGPGTLHSIAVCGVAVSIVLVSGVIMVRRWWIRRQNPALFQEDR